MSVVWPQLLLAERARENIQFGWRSMTFQTRTKPHFIDFIRELLVDWLNFESLCKQVAKCVEFHIRNESAYWISFIQGDCTQCVCLSDPSNQTNFSKKEMLQSFKKWSLHAACSNYTSSSNKIYLLYIRTMNCSSGSKIYTTMDMRSLPDTQTMVFHIPLRTASRCATFSQPLSSPVLVSTPR